MPVNGVPHILYYDSIMKLLLLMYSAKWPVVHEKYLVTSLNYCNIRNKCVCTDIFTTKRTWLPRLVFEQLPILVGRISQSRRSHGCYLVHAIGGLLPNDGN